MDSNTSRFNLLTHDECTGDQTLIDELFQIKTCFDPSDGVLIKLIRDSPMGLRRLWGAGTLAEFAGVVAMDAPRRRLQHR